MRSFAFENAVDAYDSRVEAEGQMMFEVGGDSAFEPFNEELCMTIIKMVEDTAHAVSELSPRARQARIRLIWKDFVAEQQQKRRTPSA